MEHNTRVEQIKTYLERLSAGEELEKVRADFAKEFKEVDPAEIMQAEQELLQGGTLASTLSKLQIGDMIPPELYEVVAEILVFVDDMDRMKAKIDQAGVK